MNKVMIKIVFGILLLACLEGCTQTQNLGIETYDQYRTQRIEERDSLFILYTVKEWSNQDWYTWEDYSKMYLLTNNQVDYFIAGTFYSPDRLKLLVWVGKKVPNAPTIKHYSDDAATNKLCPTAGDTIFTLSALIGLRDSVSQVWELYPFDQQGAGCFDSKDKVVNILGQYYFEKMKTHQMYRMMQTGGRKGHLELDAYGYNLQDKNFWNECWLWKKDLVGSYGLYPFQIQRYSYVGDRCDRDCAVPFSPPVLDYPEDILKLYQ